MRKAPLTPPRINWAKAKSKRAEISIWGGISLLDPASPTAQQVLCYRRMGFAPLGPLGHANRVEQVAMYRFDFRGRIGFSTGLVPRLVNRLKDGGVAVTITDHRQFGPEHLADSALRDKLYGERRELLDSLAANPLGQIVVRKRTDALWRIVDICRLFPAARIVVTAASIKKAKELQRALDAAIDEPVGLAASRPDHPGRRVVVSTFWKLNSFESDKAHIVCLCDAAENCDETARQYIANLTHHPCRVYALVRASDRFGAATQLKLEAMAGQVIYSDVPEPATVHVQICRAASFPSAKTPAAGLDRKRTLVWKHPSRNQLLGRIGRAVITCDFGELWAMGIGLEPAHEGWLRLASSNISVAVLVESLEHARNIGALLPGWQILGCGPAVEDRPGNNRDTCAATQSRGVIATFTYAATIGLDAGVIIRADGGACPLPVKKWPPEKDNCLGGAVYLIDIDDDADPQSRRDLQIRIHYYTGRAWRVAHRSERRRNGHTDTYPSSRSRRPQDTSRRPKTENPPDPVYATGKPVPSLHTTAAKPVTKTNPVHTDPIGANPSSIHRQTLSQAEDPLETPAETQAPDRSHVRPSGTPDVPDGYSADLTKTPRSSSSRRKSGKGERAKT